MLDLMRNNMQGIINHNPIQDNYDLLLYYENKFALNMTCPYITTTYFLGREDEGF